MLNLTQRLILGCVLLACLTVGLVAVTRKVLAAAGQIHLAYAVSVAALVIAAATIYFVLWPIRTLASPRAIWNTVWNGAAGTALV